MTIPIDTLIRVALRNVATTAFLLGFILFATTYGGIGNERQDWKAPKSLKDIKHIIVIYQENWSFDSLYGQFPGADGYANSFGTLPAARREGHSGVFVADLPDAVATYGIPVGDEPAVPWRGREVDPGLESQPGAAVDTLRLHNLHCCQCFHW